MTSGRERKRKWDDAEKPDDDAISAAIAAASKINAMLQASQPPTPAPPSNPPPPTDSRPPPPVPRHSYNHEEQSPVSGRDQLPEMDVNINEYDGESYCKKIELNDVRNRYVVTRPEMQTQIEQETGVKVETRGKYYPDRRLATDRDPAIHLFLTAPSVEALEKAIDLIKTELSKDLGFLASGNLHNLWPELKVPVGIETGTVHFPLRLKLVGQNGLNVKYIANECNGRVQLKGRGSMFKEANGLEADEPLYIHVTCPTYEGLEKARTLVESLISTIKNEFEQQRSMAAYGMYAAYYGGGMGDQQADPYAAYYAQQYGYSAASTGDYSAYYNYQQPPPPPPPEEAPMPPPE